MSLWKECRRQGINLEAIVITKLDHKHLQKRQWNNLWWWTAPWDTKCVADISCLNHNFVSPVYQLLLEESPFSVSHAKEKELPKSYPIIHLVRQVMRRVSWNLYRVSSVLSGLDLLMVKHGNHDLCSGLNKVKINRSFSETLTSRFPIVELSIDQCKAVSLKKVPWTADLSILPSVTHHWGGFSFPNGILQKWNSIKSDLWLKYLSIYVKFYNW